LKSKDLLVLSGVGLLAYILLKPKTVEAEGGVTVIPMGEAPTGLGMGLGEIFGSIENIFGAMPSQIIPEIHIPEFKLPDIDISEFTAPDWEKILPDWEMFLPKIPDEGLIPDIPSLIPDVSDLLPSIPSILGGNGDGAMMGVGKTLFSQWDIFWNKVNKRLQEPIAIVGTFGHLFYDPMTARFMTKGDIEREPFRAESEAIFKEAGITEVGSFADIETLIKATETVRGESIERLPPIGSPDYWNRMLGQPKPIVEKN